VGGDQWSSRGARLAAEIEAKPYCFEERIAAIENALVVRADNVDMRACRLAGDRPNQIALRPITGELHVKVC
jgi:hypothetical protein